MKFSASRASLLAAFAVVKPAIARQAFMKSSPFSCVHVSATSCAETRYIAHDGEMTISHYSPDFKVSEFGEGLIPLKAFDLVERSKDCALVTISAAEESCVVGIDGREFKLATPRAIDFGAYLPAYSPTKEASDLPADFRARVAAVWPHASKDVLRPQLTGVHLCRDHRGLCVESTDGHTGRVIASPPVGVDCVARPFSCILPPRIAKLLASSWCRDLPAPLLRWNSETREAWLRWDSVSVYFYLVEGRFPHMARVTPDTDTDRRRWVVRRGNLEAMLKRFAIFCTDDDNYAVFDLHELKCRAAFENLETGDAALEPLPATYTGAPLRIGFRVDLLRRVIALTASDLIEFELTSASGACIIRAKHSADPKPAEARVSTCPQSEEYSLLMPHIVPAAFSVFDELSEVPAAPRGCAILSADSEIILSRLELL